MRHIIIDSHDPAFNLALEEHLFQTLPDGHPGYFLLWQNSPVIVIGRHQMPQKEINTALAQQLKLPIIRRNTGGGCVYHDLGNLNFSFILNVNANDKISFARFLEPVCGALAELGAMAEISGRNDLEILGKKISGSAQTKSGGKVLHHGTLLVNSNLHILGQILSPAKSKYESKGVASVRARVANIAEYWRPGSNMEVLKEALIRHCAPQRDNLDKKFINEAETLADKKYRAESWNFGESPAYDAQIGRKFPWGLVSCRVRIKKDKITNCKITGDFFSNDDISFLENKLNGCQFNDGAIKAALADVDWHNYFLGGDADAMRDFFLEMTR